MSRRVLIPLVCLALFSGGCKSRDEKLQAAEDKAKFVTETKARIVKGVGDVLQDEGKKAAESISAGAGQVLKGIGQGLDKGFKEIRVQVSPGLAEAGLQVTRANQTTARESGAGGKVVTAYVVFDKPFAGELELRALSEAGGEVGRASAKVSERAGAARYVDFTFDERAPVAVTERFELR